LNTHPTPQEAIQVLAGGGPADVAALVEAQCAEMLVLAGLVPDRAAGCSPPPLPPVLTGRVSSLLPY